jgi:hypothetical protein
LHQSGLSDRENLLVQLGLVSLLGQLVLSVL